MAATVVHPVSVEPQRKAPGPFGPGASCVVDAFAYFDAAASSLIAADIIRTVAVTPTLNSVLILGIIVLIRTFLSISMQVEIEGRFPWQRQKAQDA